MKTTSKKILPFTEVQTSVESLQARHHQRSGVIYLSTLICLLGFLGSTPLIKIDIQKQSRGIIRTVQENNQIIAPLYGQLSSVYLRDGQTVQKGDLLLELDTRKIDQQIEQQQQLLAKNQQYLSDLAQLLDTNLVLSTLKTPLYQSARFQFEKQKRQYEIQLERAERAWQRADQLYQSGTIAQVEWEEKKYQRDYQHSLLEQFQQEQQQAWTIARKDYEIQNLDIVHRIAQLAEEKRQYRVSAPISGTIQQFSGVQAGNYVSPGQQIAQIITHDSLLVEVYVSPADIGMLAVGMPVRFQIDAFNYNQWGLAEGTVTEIAQDISTLEGQPLFLVRCQLSQNSLQLKNGYQGQLKKGMTLTARFQLSRRSLYQLLYDKVDNWVNPQII
jgi:HlyD family secretion protein